MNDSSVYVNGAKAAIRFLSHLQSTKLAEIRFARYSGVDGWGGKVKTLLEVYNAGLWYNRTSGDVVTIYPYAVTMSETFTFAIKFRATGGSSDPRLFTIGNTQSGYSALSCILRTSTGVVDVVRSENGSITGTASVADLGSSP